MYSESYYEVGIGELLDWQISPGWADGGWVKVHSLLNDREMQFALCGVVDISDHFIPTWKESMYATGDVSLRQ